MWGWKESVSVKSRFYLSLLHIQSAALLSRRSGQIEKEYDGNFSNELTTEYWACVTASIFTVVAFLEATINEFFADAGEKHGENRLDSSTKALMAEEWKLISKDYNVRMMDKFDKALALAEKPKFDRGKQPAQDIALIVQLRNSLVHYYPEWMNDETEAASMSITKKDFIRSLRGKFPTNPLVSENSPLFPQKCLSYGCTQWGMQSSIAYSDEFFARLGVPAPYEHIRQCLRTA